MDAASMQALIESFQQMAKSNQDLVQAMQAGVTPTQTAPSTAPTQRNDGDHQAANDMIGAVALTGIKVPLFHG